MPLFFFEINENYIRSLLFTKRENVKNRRFRQGYYSKYLEN